SGTPPAAADTQCGRKVRTAPCSTRGHPRLLAVGPDHCSTTSHLYADDPSGRRTTDRRADPAANEWTTPADRDPSSANQTTEPAVQHPAAAAMDWPAPRPRGAVDRGRHYLRADLGPPHLFRT